MQALHDVTEDGILQIINVYALAATKHAAGFEIQVQLQKCKVTVITFSSLGY